MIENITQPTKGVPWSLTKEEVAPATQAYVESVGIKQSELKKEIRNVTREKFGDLVRMITAPQSGELLKSLIMLQKPKKVLEIGVFTGYSSICIAEALPEDGRLYALDNNEEFVELAKSFWRKANLSHKIEPIIDDALNTLTKLMEDSSNLESFDLAYIDADKENYSEYYEATMKLVKSKGAIVIDNVLWGSVSINETLDRRAAPVKALVKKIKSDSRVEHYNMVGVEGGYSIVIKK